MLIKSKNERFAERKSTVDKRDTVYILGDLTFLKSENAPSVGETAWAEVSD